MSAALQTDFEQLEILIPDHLDDTADLNALHYPKLADKQPFVMYTRHHFEIELKLTPCARLLWSWILLKAPAGVKVGIDLRDFQAICAEQRRGRPYCMRQIRNAFKELEELGLLIDKTDRRQVIARHPGPITNETTNPQLRKLISKARKLTSTPPYINKYPDPISLGENLKEGKIKEVDVASTLELVASLQAQINVLVASLDPDRDKFSASGVCCKIGHESIKTGDVDEAATVGHGDITTDYVPPAAQVGHGEIETGDVGEAAQVGHGEIGTGDVGEAATVGHGGIKTGRVHRGASVGHKGITTGIIGRSARVGHGNITPNNQLQEIWEAAPAQPYPAFLNWKASLFKQQGGHWEINAIPFAYSEFYNHRTRTTQVLWPQFMKEVKQMVEQNHQLRAAGMEVVLPSWFAAQLPEPTEANVQQLMANLEAILPGSKVALPQTATSSGSYQAIPYEQAIDASIAPLPVLESKPAVEPSKPKQPKSKKISEIVERIKEMGKYETCKQVCE